MIITQKIFGRKINHGRQTNETLNTKLKIRQNNSEMSARFFFCVGCFIKLVFLALNSMCHLFNFARNTVCAVKLNI